MNTIRNVRRVRLFNIGALIFSAAVFAFDMAIGSAALAAVPAVAAAASVACIRVNMATIRRMEDQARPRPDYAAIARMEREVYGEAPEADSLAQIMLAHAELQARIAAIGQRGRVGRQRSPLCPCGGTLPGHIRSSHYLPGYDAAGKMGARRDR